VKAVRRASGFVLVTLCLLTSGQRKLKWREQTNALIEGIVEVGQPEIESATGCGHTASETS
jgi:hypothetical protein